MGVPFKTTDKLVIQIHYNLGDRASAGKSHSTTVPRAEDESTMTSSPSLVFDGAGTVKRGNVVERIVPHERSRLAPCLMRSTRKLKFDRPKTADPQIEIAFDFR